jgi:hypothetical protein
VAPPRPGSTEALAAELDGLSGGLTSGHEATFRSILGDALAVDPYVCRPSPRQVFFGDVPDGTRTIGGVMPHYGFFFGPMSYRVGHGPDGWRVALTIAVDLPPDGGVMELPDCGLPLELAGGGDLGAIGAACSGTAYSASAALEPCPRTGTFSLPATRRTMRALLDRWSREAHRYYDRDAAALGLPVRYEITFLPADELGGRLADLRVPLSLTCGRTPYFASFRSGWSLPVVAHESGHVLGLLDEYETFSGIASFYPKTPFPGAEVSRFGLSMREGTHVLPLHHYLVLRRWFCAEPRGGFYDVL